MAYEEFCCKYDLLKQDLAMLRRSVSNWETFDQGVEALCKSVAPINTRKVEGNQSMTLNDLLIKVFFFFLLLLKVNYFSTDIARQPIQRLCKYPLLLQDLLRYTAVSDCPTSHESIQEILQRIRVPVTRINEATGNPVTKDRIEKTVLLQEKLQFDERV